MTAAAPVYDLMLVLDPEGEEPARAKVVSDARQAIETGGELLRHDDWGERPLSYPIRRRKSGEYHLMQFHAPDTELLSGLDRTLRITDGVLRFRLIKLKPGTPAPPEVRAPGAAPARRQSAERPPEPPAGAEAGQPPADASPPAAVEAESAAAPPPESGEPDSAAGAQDAEAPAPEGAPEQPA